MTTNIIKMIKIHDFIGQIMSSQVDMTLSITYLNLDRLFLIVQANIKNMNEMKKTKNKILNNLLN